MLFFVLSKTSLLILQRRYSKLLAEDADEVRAILKADGKAGVGHALASKKQPTGLREAKLDQMAVGARSRMEPKASGKVGHRAARRRRKLGKRDFFGIVCRKIGEHKENDGGKRISRWGGFRARAAKEQYVKKQREFAYPSPRSPR